jgi:alpha-maltose-1-phosphate synthase
VRRLDVSISRRQRYRLAAKTFHPVRGQWQGRFRRAVYEAHSLNCAELLDGDREPNVILQMFRMFQARGLPYWLFLDTTDAIRQAAGRETPFGPEGLGYGTERDLYQGAEHIFVMPNAPKRSLVRDYGVDEDAVSVVGAGVNIDYPESLGELGKIDRYRQSTVFFVGRDFEGKGGPELLQAFREVRAVVPDARLVIVGVALPSDPPGVQSLGQVLDRGDLVRMYEKAAVFCAPSRFEATGMSVMEAMAYGLPIVGTRVGGIAEAVRDGHSGILVEPGDAEGLGDGLVRLLSDPLEALEMGRNGRRLIDTERNWDAVVDRMLESVSQSAEPAAGSDRPIPA